MLLSCYVFSLTWAPAIFFFESAIRRGWANSRLRGVDNWMSRVRLDKDSPVANRGTIADGLVLSSRLILLYLTQPGQFADERVGRPAWQQWEGSRTSGPLSLGIDNSCIYQHRCCVNLHRQRYLPNNTCFGERQEISRWLASSRGAWSQHRAFTGIVSNRTNITRNHDHGVSAAPAKTNSGCKVAN